VQNYLPTAAEVTFSVARNVPQIHDLFIGSGVAPAPAADRDFGGASRFGDRGAAPQRSSFNLTVLPHSYVAFATKQTLHSSPLPRPIHPPARR
jgi:hypothetical protein